MMDWLRKLHRWAAFSGLAFFVVIGFTGVALVFQNAIEEVIRPRPRLAEPHENVRYQPVLDAARARTPHALVWVINPPRDPLQAVEALAEGPEELLMYVHPTTGQVLSSGAVHKYPVEWLRDLHIKLLAGELGKVVVLVVGLALSLMVPTGLALWWPRTLKAALRYRLSANGLMFYLDLHRLAGVVGGLVLLAVAVTGVLLLYPEVSMRVADQLSGAHRAKPAIPGSLPHEMDLDEIVAQANSALPGGRVTRVTIAANGTPVVVRKRSAGERHPNGLTLIAVDPASARVLSAVPAARAGISIRMWEWIYPLHAGVLFGAVNTLLLLVAGVLPALLGTTGVVVWLYRRKRRS